MKIQINVIKINYSEIIDKLMQLKAVQKESSSFLPLFSNMVSGKITLLPQRLKDIMILRIFEQNQSAITEQINRALSDNEIELEIKNVLIEGDSGFMKIQLEVENVNYSQVAVRFLPKIIGLIPKNDNTKVFTDALDILNDNLEGIVKDLLDNIGEEKKEQLVKLFANHYSLNISSLLNKLISDNGITAEIVDFSIY